MAIMQANVTLNGEEILFTADAVEAVAQRYEQSGSGGMVRPYRDILGEIERSMGYGDGTEAAVGLAGGYIDCMSFALRQAAGKDADMSRVLLNRIGEATHELGDAPAPHAPEDGSRASKPAHVVRNAVIRTVEKDGKALTVASVPMMADRTRKWGDFFVSAIAACRTSI